MKELITKEESNAIKERMIFLIEQKDREKLLQYIADGFEHKKYKTYKRLDLFQELNLMSVYAYASLVISNSRKAMTKTPQFTKLWEGLWL